MERRLISFSKWSVFLLLISLSFAVQARYYPSHSSSCSCHKSTPHKHKHHHRHHRAYYYESGVIYYPLYPCGFSGCSGYYAAPRDYVTFVSAPTSYVGAEYVHDDDNQNYDMRTADDDVCDDPDMNNQY